MNWFVISLSMACAFSFAGAGTAREFRTSDGVARIRLVPQSGIVSDSPETAIPDSTSDLFASIAAGGGEGDEALLEIYFLDLGTGKELRFPIKVSYLREFLIRKGPAAKGASRNDFVIAVVQSLSKELSVRMKTPVKGTEK